jgi:uncharacterized delta-60 repeat protein
MWQTFLGLSLALSSNAAGRPAPRRRPAVHRPSHRPRLEELEGRCLLSAGMLDPTFGNGAGYVITAPTNPSSVQGGEILLQPDGKIIETGYGFAGGKNGKITASDFVAVRYNTDGSLDRSFGTGGIALAPSAHNGVTVQKSVGPLWFNVNALWSALYPNAGTANDGKIVLEGWYPVQVTQGAPFVNELALVRFNANGTLDTTFGSGGEVLTSFSVGGTNLGVVGAGVVVTSTGQIVECGNVGNGSGSPAYTVLARFNANGTLDTTFGQGGKVITPGPGAENLIQQPDGRLVAPAATSTGGAILRYNANGTLDTTFGSGGIVTNAAFDAVAAAVYPTAGTANDGKIVVVGPGPTNGEWEAARYNPNGTLDSTFGSGGMVNTQTSSYTARGVAIQADGNIVAAGDGFILVRYNPDGSLDGTFGTGGIVTTPSLSAIGGGLFRNVVLQTNGDILAGGSINIGGGNDFAVARYLPSEPEIASFTASPNPVPSGSGVTLTASNITDANPNATITQVAFYRDSNGDGILEPGTDALLGYATQTSPGVWTFTFTVSLAPGTYTLFAQAQDSYGVFGDPVALTLTVQ